jgi:O-methyltransferase
MEQPTVQHAEPSAPAAVKAPAPPPPPPPPPVDAPTRTTAQDAGDAAAAAATAVAAAARSELKARLRGPIAKLRAAQKEAAVHERTAKRAIAKLEREREAWTAKMARLRGELDELRKSYHLSGVGKKLDLREMSGFSEIASEIVAARRTGMNYDRLYTLWQAVRAAPPDEPVIEIGSYLGGSARFISEALQANGATPRFYVCDTFAGHAQTDATIDTSHHGSGKFEDVSAEATAAYLEGYPALELVVGDIVQTSRQLPEKSFGLVHLDVDVYPTTDYCLRFFAPRLAENAVMVIDDYGTITCPGVKRAADEFVAEFPQFRLWHLLTGQAILTRIAPRP